MDKLLLFLFTVCCSATFCHACFCPPISSADEYCTYDMIFLGTTLAEYKERNKPFDPALPEFADVFADFVYTVHVEKILWAKKEFKGLTTLSLTTPVSDSMCGTRLELDITYLLFARAYDGKFRTGICQSNAPWDYVSESFKQFISNIIPRHCARITERIVQ